MAENFLLNAFRLAASAVVGCWAFSELNRLVNIQRGYQTIGGEIFIGIIVAIIAYKITKI